MKTVQPVTLRTMQPAALRVDREAGVIAGVAVITAGNTLTDANGNPPMVVDAVTLKQVADFINASSIGVKSRITHESTLTGGDEIRDRVGYFRNARIDGDSVRADFHAHVATDAFTLKLMSIAEQDAASCGTSIVSTKSYTEPTIKGPALRINSLEAVDWVGEPAANPRGMLSTKTSGTLPPKATGQNTKGFVMELNEQQIEYLRELGLSPEATADDITAFLETLTPEQQAELDAVAAPVAEGEPAPAAPAPAPVAVSKGKAKAKPAAKPAPVVVDDEPAATLVELDEIATLANLPASWVVEQGKLGKTAAEAKAIALAAVKKGRTPVTLSGNPTITGGRNINLETINDAVRDAVLLRAGARKIVKLDSEGSVMLSANGAPEMHKHHERASEFRGRSLIEIGRRYLIALGYRDADNLNPTALAGILLSRAKLREVLPGGVFLAGATGDFPYLLADAMGKVLRSEYVLQPHTWSQWCAKRTTPDFKDIKVLQLGEAADLVVIPEGDQYTFAQLTESREVYAVQTQGTGLKFTRQMLINDDLSAFDRVPKKLGSAAMRAVEAKAISILTANAALADGGALFNSTAVTTTGGHANTTTGALTAAAAVASIDAAMTSMRTKVALGSDDPLDIMPKFALVPTTQYFKAKVAFASGVDPSLANATPNPIASEGVTVIQSARLDADSTAEWYLLADPNQYDTVEVAFLEGEETPVIEEETDFNSDSLHMKVRHTFNAKAIDWRGMVRGSGS
jgi:hypothetical protein